MLLLPLVEGEKRNKCSTGTSIPSESIELTRAVQKSQKHSRVAIEHHSHSCSLASSQTGNPLPFSRTTPHDRRLLQSLSCWLLFPVLGQTAGQIAAGLKSQPQQPDFQRPGHGDGDTVKTEKGAKRQLIQTKRSKRFCGEEDRTKGGGTHPRYCPDLCSSNCSSFSAYVSVFGRHATGMAQERGTSAPSEAMLRLKKLLFG